MRTTDYSQYYDLARMQSVRDQTMQFVRDGAVPSQIIAQYKKLDQDR